MIETRDLTKRFGSLVAVDGLTVEIGEPGIVGFLGPNGAGKTTTLRMLTGFTAMTSGSARVAGFDIFDSPQQAKAHLGYLPETPPLYPELTVGEYLRFAADIRGVTASDRLSRVGAAMERVDLMGHEGALLGSLSKGFRQRVGLAQAIVHDPPVVLLDEPTSGLDPAQLRSMRQLVSDLSADRTVVLSTHVLSEVETLCDRILLMDGGRLLADGTLASLAEQVGARPWVELWLDAPDDDVSARIAGLKVVQSVERFEPRRYRVVGDAAVEPALGGMAGAHGWKIRALVRRLPTLEQVFVALVGSASESSVRIPVPEEAA